MIVKLLCFGVPAVNLILQLPFILGSFSVLQKLDLAVVSLVVIQSFDLVIGFNCVPANKQIHEKSLIERIL